MNARTLTLAVAATAAIASSAGSANAQTAVDCGSEWTKQQVERLVTITTSTPPGLDPYPINRVGGSPYWPKIATNALLDLRGEQANNRFLNASTTRDNQAYLVLSGTKKSVELRATGSAGSSPFTVYYCAYSFAGELTPANVVSKNLTKMHSGKLVVTTTGSGGTQSTFIQNNSATRLVTLLLVSPHSWTSKVAFTLQSRTK